MVKRVGGLSIKLLPGKAPQSCRGKAAEVAAREARNGRGSKLYFVLLLAGDVETEIT